MNIEELHAQCLRLCAELRECLRQERSCVIRLDMDGILECNVRKEGLGAALQHKRRELKMALQGETLSAELSAAWSQAWAETRRQCEENQAFLKHSVRNMGLLVDNLKRLMGDDTPLYSNKGTPAQAGNTAKVVEAKY